VYTYDANGNRLTQSGTANALYSVGAANNQLATVVGGLSRTCSYDASGNVTGNGVLALTYNAAGRIVTANNGTITTSYIYNALGQRVEKSNANSTTYFVYDGAGHLIGEYDAGGNLIQEVVWMGETPIASIRIELCGLSVFYIHTDHLNTPRRITRRSTTDVVWSWESDPFGSTAPNENASGLGTFSFNLRFPGQYYDAETGQSYNTARHYEPTVGRYIESDPLGLKAGIKHLCLCQRKPSEDDPTGEDTLGGLNQGVSQRGPRWQT
jgi:RHS repeat-associated protein